MKSLICIYSENLITIKQDFLYIENFLIGYILFKVNQTKVQVPEDIFQVNELTHCLDFDEDARKRHAWKMSLVSMACTKRTLDHRGVNVGILCCNFLHEFPKPLHSAELPNRSSRAYWEK